MSQTERQMAVKTLRALQRAAAIVEAQADAWQDIDQFLRNELQGLQSRFQDGIAEVQVVVDETYPGRRKKGQAA